jgi:translocation and assembly module TamB
MLVLLALLGLGLASANDTAFAWLVRQAALLTSDRFSVEASQGSLWRHFQLTGLRYQDHYQKIELDRFALSWRPRELLAGRVHITELQLGHIKRTLLKLAPPAAPAVAPTSLALPWAVRIDALTLQSYSEAGSVLALFDGRASYVYGEGRHQLRLQRLGSPWGRAGLELNVADSKPFALAGALKLGGELEGVAYDGALQLSGNLLAPQLNGAFAGQGMLAELNGLLAPFEPLFYHKVRRLDLRVGGVNPYVLNPIWPKARLNLAVSVQPEGKDGLAGGASLLNLEPKHAAAQALPIKLFNSDFSVRGDTLLLRQGKLDLTSGTIDVAGTINPKALALTAKLADISPDVLWPGAPKPSLNGSLQLTGSMQQPVVSANLTAGQQHATGRLLLDNRPGSRSLALDKLRIGNASGATVIDAKLGLDQPLPLTLKAQLAHADLAQLGAPFPKSDLNGTLNVAGQAGQGQKLALALALSPSKLGGASLTGQVQGSYGNGRLSGLLAALRLAENRLDASGNWGAPKDKLLLKIDAPALAKLGPGFGGALRGTLELSGSKHQPLLSGTLRGERLSAPGGNSARLVDFSGQVLADPRAPFKLKLDAGDVVFGTVRIDTLKLNVDGTRANHQIAAHSEFKLGGRPQQLELAASGGLAAETQIWQGVVSRLQLAGDAGLALQAPVKLTAGRARVSLPATRLALLGGEVRLEHLEWSPGQGLNTRGTAANLTLKRLEPWGIKFPLEQNLVLGGDWDLAQALTAQAHGRLTLHNVSGDVVLPGVQGRSYPLGLQRGELEFKFAGGRTQLTAWIESQLMQLNGTANLAAPHGVPDFNAPLTGAVKFNLPSLAALGSLAGPGLELAGSFKADLLLSGTAHAPQWRGQIAGEKLLFSDHRSGFKLTDGSLAALVDGRALTLQRLRFAGGEGEVVAVGTVDAREVGPNASARVEFRRFTVFDTPARRLIVSGQSDLSLNEQGLKLTGRLRADRGRLDLPKQGAPQLSGDVVVKGRAPPPPSTFAKLPITAELDLDFGDRFRMVGQGLDVELTGVVRVSAKPGGAPAALGQVKVVSGRYRAYGQDLDIERGVITFSGSFDNPALSVRAKRRLSPVGAGVEVSGSVNAPIVRLVADEPMTDKDKLAWLVLGRAASAGGGDDAALALAAGSLLAGGVNQRLGLFDDLGVIRREQHTSASGRVSAAEQVLVVGKQLSRQLFVGYEYGIKSAEQALKLAYQLTKGWALVLHAGTDSSLETRYTVRFD